MSFWKLDASSDALAVHCVDSDSPISYAELQSRVDAFKLSLEHFTHKTLGFIRCANNIESIVAYLAALQSRHAVVLLDANLNSDLFTNLVERYQPDWLFMPEALVEVGDYESRASIGDYCLLASTPQEVSDIYGELAVLLTTSGSTGNPKMVRLSYGNLQANAEAIANYLELTPSEKPITTLPMHYSYGLSVLNSHLLAGATVLLTNETIVSRQLWGYIEQYQATSVAGVPYIYQMLHRMRFARMELPSLRTMTQAGGKLSEDLVAYFDETCRKNGCRFFVMYGQTEATARISYVPHEQVLHKPGSIGLPIPGGRMTMDNETGELIYEGPNVMLGYAEKRADLSLADHMNGRLRTGDLVQQDQDGYFYIKGRMKRFLKLFGLRINLDDIESTLEQLLPCHVACVGDDTALTIFLEDAAQVDEAKKIVHERFHIHPQAQVIKTIDEIPHSGAGKRDYKKLMDAR